MNGNAIVRKCPSLNLFLFNPSSGLLASGGLCVENPGDDPLQWLRDSIPGEPGVDYPIFSAVEETGFSCDDKIFGGEFGKGRVMKVR